MSSGSAILSPFRIPRDAFRPLPSALKALLATGAERLFALSALNRVYQQARTPHSQTSFADSALRALDVQIQVHDADVSQIPRSGPLIVVANHPFGGLDGLALLALLKRVRPDVKLLANRLLARIPEIQADCLFADVFAERQAANRNRAVMKSALSWLKNGGVCAIFPAGEVSHLSVQKQCVTDPEWTPSVARLVALTKAAVLPVHFDGSNSRLFQWAGLLHPRLRTALLPRELLRRRGARLNIAIGSPILFERMSRILKEAPDVRAGAKQLTEYLRLRTYILKGRSASNDSAAKRVAKARMPELIASASPIDLLTLDVEFLPAQQCLASSGDFRVFYAAATQLPHVLPEIGRLREITFRQVGEGTGRSIDLDEFDSRYLHLFAWNQRTREVVGAYRMGQTDVLLERFGPRGLYTNTLFKYRAHLLHELNPALELGRSFVIPEYQREFAPLMLLWKGIGRFVALHPRYRRLLGAVSISDEFQTMTRQLLMAFLRVQNSSDEHAQHVQPRNPPKLMRFRDADEKRLATLITSMSDVEELVGEIESSRRGVPVLLRQYLKLNAKLLGFNVDSDFGGALDGLVLVDLTTVERPVLNRYLGPDGAAKFLAFHGLCNEST